MIFYTHPIQGEEQGALTLMMFLLHAELARKWDQQQTINHKRFLEDMDDASPTRVRVRATQNLLALRPIPSR